MAQIQILLILNKRTFRQQRSDIMEKIKAIGYTGAKELNDPDSFIEFEFEKPIPGDSELLVEIKAVSINPVDMKLRRAAREIQIPPKILGRDSCGIVEAIGNKVTLFKKGEKVFYSGSILKPGSNASHQLVDERIVGHFPQKLSFAEAAAMPLTSLTAWESIFDRLKVNLQKDAGKNILIIGGAGGVGSIAIQIAKNVAKLNVIATASREESIEWCKKMGADIIINHHNLIEEYKSQNKSAPDFILCCNDTDYYYDSMVQLVAPQGMICVMVDAVKEHDLQPLKAKSAGIVWEFMATRPIFETSDMIKQHHYLNEISTLLDKGTLKSTMTKIIGSVNVENVKKAHHLIESGRTIGKMVMEGFYRF